MLKNIFLSIPRFFKNNVDLINVKYYIVNVVGTDTISFLNNL